MPNVFKNAISDTITTVTTVYTAPSGMSSILVELDIANTASTTVNVDVKINDNSAATEIFLIKAVPIPVGSSLQVIAGQKIVLESLDALKIISTDTVDAIASILEDV